MPRTRKESDAWLIIQGDSQEGLDRIHAKADAMRSRLEVEGRGPSTAWEPVSSDDEEFGDVQPMTPPPFPRWVPRGKSLSYLQSSRDQGLNFKVGATTEGMEFVTMDIQHPKLGGTPLQTLSAIPSTQVYKVQRQRQRRNLVPASVR